ncbi:translation elongation factor P (EF-P) [Nitrosomonas marina]|uniref:Elongation factor P n=1 Tax=Nitrosomonas marina TaxID=917 RepID=A0A1I0DHK3_9PROT|nr:elongation factor P [Nitrosomonas marina]SET31926.1 translation elongation factor P (EF-P) [Nitrosomonas marina]
MKISAFEVRVGNLIEYQNKLWRVNKKNHVKPGKGGAFVQLEMKAVVDGTKLNERFRSEDKVEKAHVEPRQMQFLYNEGDSYIFMDNESYEQLALPADELEDQAPYLLPNTDVLINFYNEDPIGLELPTSVILEVTETEVMMKGQTAVSGGKPAVLETGLKVSVPQFVNIGDKIKVNTDTGEYIERA